MGELFNLLLILEFVPHDIESVCKVGVFDNPHLPDVQWLEVAAIPFAAVLRVRALFPRFNLAMASSYLFITFVK